MGKRKRQSAQKGEAVSTPQTASPLITDESLLHVLALAPLLIGAFTASAFHLKELLSFALAITPFVLIRRFFRPVTRPLTLRSLIRPLFFAVLIAADSSAFMLAKPAAAMPEQAVMATLLLLCALAAAVVEQSSGETVRGVLLRCFTVFVQMSVLPVIGVYTQSGLIIYSTAFLGSASAAIVCAALICREARLFDQSGWTRRYEAKNRKGQTVQRPGGSSRLLSLLLVVVPAVPVMLASLQKLPMPFMLLCASVLLSIKTAADFFEKRRADQEIAQTCFHLAFLTTVLSLFAGLFSRSG